MKKEIKKERESAEEFELTDYDNRKYFWKYILGLFLILLIILMVVPEYTIKIDPEPANVPRYDEIVLYYPEIDRNFNRTVFYKEDFYKFLDFQDDYIKSVADRIASGSCKEYSKVCYAKAMFYFVRDELIYINDPVEREYVKTARETIKTRGGDCEDLSILLANLLGAVGIESRFVFIPGHVFVQVHLPEAQKKYKFEDDYINLEPTCKNCKFGELPASTIKYLRQK